MTAREAAVRVRPIPPTLVDRSMTCGEGGERTFGLEGKGGEKEERRKGEGREKEGRRKGD